MEFGRDGDREVAEEQISPSLTLGSSQSEGCTALHAVLAEPDSNTPPLPFAAEMPCGVREDFRLQACESLIFPKR